MLNLTNLIGFGGGGNIPKATFIGTTTFYNGANRTSQTYSAVPIGTPSPDRIVVLGFTGNGASPATLTVAKLGGAGGTPMNIIATTTSNTTGGALAYLLYPEGTSVDIYLEFSPYSGADGISIHTVTGWNEPAPYVYSVDGTDVITLSANVQAGSVGIAHTGGSTIVATPTCTWVGMTLNETLNVYNNGVVSSAVETFALTESPRTITADWANLSTSAVGLFAAWR